MKYVLAGDVGGTKTVLCLYSVSNDTSNNAVVQEVHKTTYPSSGYAFFSELIVSFLSEFTSTNKNKNSKQPNSHTQMKRTNTHMNLD
ncbi:MAG: glucokinase [Gammaproteobacteria bacterium]